MLIIIFILKKADSYTTQRPPQINIQIHQVVPPPVQQPVNRNRIRNIQNYDDDLDIDDMLDSDNDMFNDGDDSDVDQDYEIDYSQSTFDEDDEDNEYEENNLEE